MKKRIIGAAIGIAYAAICGFISLLSTGGGHGSLMWVFLFVVPELCGIYFPMMGFLGADLSSLRSRWIFGMILAVNVIISIVLIVGGFTDDPYTTTAWNADPQGAVFITAFHIAPSLIFTAMLLVSVLTAKPDAEITTPTILS